MYGWSGSLLYICQERLWIPSSATISFLLQTRWALSHISSLAGDSPFPSTRFWFKVHPFQVELIRRSPMNFEEYWAVVFFQNSQCTGRHIHLIAGLRRLVREIFRESSQFWWSHHPSCCSCATRLLVAATVSSFIHTVKGEEPEQEVGFFQRSCLATFEGWIPIARKNILWGPRRIFSRPSECLSLNYRSSPAP